MSSPPNRLPLPVGLHPSLSTYSPDGTPLPTPSLASADPKAQIDLLKGINDAFSKEHAGEEGLSVVLRKGIAKAHEEVLQPEIVGQLVSGSLPRPIHLLYLLSLYRLYTTLETSLQSHLTHPSISLLYNPLILSRVSAIEKDCEYYSGGDPLWLRRTMNSIEGRKGLGGEGKDGDDLGGGKRKRDALEVYTDRLRELGEAKEGEDDDKIDLLVAHAFVRYLGDLSGGQSIARSLRKSYNLPSDSGTAFYEFPPSPNSTQIATAPELKSLKTTFRKNLDTIGLTLSPTQKSLLVLEAQQAFKYNIELFKEFEVVVKKYKEPPKSSHHGATIAQRNPPSSSSLGNYEVDEAIRRSKEPDNVFIVYAVFSLTAGLLVFSFIKDYTKLGEWLYEGDWTWRGVWEVVKGLGLSGGRTEL